MSDKSIKRKTFKDLNLLDSFLFCEATENPENAKLYESTTSSPIFTMKNFFQEEAAIIYL